MARIRSQGGGSLMVQKQTGQGADLAGEEALVVNKPSSIAPNTQSQEQTRPQASDAPQALVVLSVYDELAPELVAKLKACAVRYLSHVRRTTDEIIRTGRDLLECKDALDHGQFVRWIKNDLGIPPRTAQSYMAAARLHEQKRDVALLPATTLQRLAAKSAPPAIVEAVIAKAVSGEMVSDAEVKDLIAQDRECRRDAEIEAKRRARLAKMPKRKRQEREREKREWEEQRQRNLNNAQQIASILLRRLGRENLTMVYAAFVASDAWGLESSVKDLVNVPGTYGVEIVADGPFSPKYDAPSFIAKFSERDVAAVTGPPPPHMDPSEWVFDIRGRLTEAALSLTEEDRNDLFSHARQHIDNLERRFRDKDTRRGDASSIENDIPAFLDRTVGRAP
jgi:hypothetical protein